MKRRLPVLALLLSLVVHEALAGGAVPECSGSENWPTKMAFVQLKNAGLTSNERIDWEAVRTKRIASERIGDDLYRQVHQVTFPQIDGTAITVITVNDASTEECSMSSVQVFVVSNVLGK